MLSKRLKMLKLIAFMLEGYGDEEEAYDTDNSYRLEKGFGICRSKTTKSGSYQKVVQKQFVRNKEYHIICDK